MKILFCIKEMHNASGGAERVLAQVASGLAALGNDVVLLSSDDADAESFYPLDPSIRWVRIGSESGSGTAKSLLILRRIFATRRIVRQLAPDVAVGFMHSAYIPLGLALLGTGMPTIASEHIVPRHYRRRPLQWLLIHLAPFLVDRITCVSEQVRLAFSPFMRKKMTVVPNPISFAAKRRANVSGAGQARKTVLSVGRLDGQKDYKTLIAAFADVAGAFPDWDLRIVGEGNLRSALEKQIMAFGLGGRVFLPGRTRAVDREYENAQLFVQPSRYESFGLTVVEALMHGLPAIGFADCLGVNQLIVDGENGILVDGQGQRTGKLAEGLAKLMAQEGLRRKLSSTPAETFREHEVDRVVNRWAALCRSLAGLLDNISLNKTRTLSR